MRCVHAKRSSRSMRLSQQLRRAAKPSCKERRCINAVALGIVVDCVDASVGFTDHGHHSARKESGCSSVKQAGGLMRGRGFDTWDVARTRSAKPPPYDRMTV